MDTRVAAYAVVVEPRGILLAHWNAGDRRGWTLPGGGIDPGEHPADAAVREVEEETGYRVALDGVLGVDSIVIPAADRLVPGAPDQHGIRIVYRGRIVGGALLHEVGGSTDEAAWWPLDQIDGLARVELVDAARRMAGLLPVVSD